MTETTKHDAWSAGDSYDAYMGRWSRKMAARFLDWLKPAENLDWLDVGCGTGRSHRRFSAAAIPAVLSASSSPPGLLRRRNKVLKTSEPGLKWAMRKTCRSVIIAGTSLLPPSS